MDETPVADVVAPFVSFVRAVVGLARMAAPEVRRLRAERGAAEESPSSVGFLEQLFDATLSRLRGGVDDEGWWRQLFVRVGHAYVAPDFLRKPTLQAWLSDLAVQNDLKRQARDKVGLGTTKDDGPRERLRSSYAEYTGEDQRLGEGTIDVVEAILIAGFLSSLRPSDVPLAAIFETGLQGIHERFDVLERNLVGGAILDQSIVRILSESARDLLRPILRRRALVPERARREIVSLEQRLDRDGDLRSAGRDVHVEILSWAARLHAQDLATVRDAVRYRDRIREMDPAADTRIIDAQIAATEGDPALAQRVLRDVDSADGRANLFSLLSKLHGPAVALEWFDEQTARARVGFLTGIGWYNVAVALAMVGRWDEAIECVVASSEHLADCPPLAYLEGTLKFAMVLPELIRKDIFETAPYMIGSPTIEGPASDHFRRSALVSLGTAARLLEELDLPDFAGEARLGSLWLRLTDPTPGVADAARAEVIEGMRDGAQAVRLLPVVRRFEIPFDPAPMRSYLDTRKRLGGLSGPETVAEFMLTMLTANAKERANYIEREEARLSVVLRRSYLTGERVMALIQDNQIVRATAVLSERRTELSKVNYERLRTLVDMHAGIDVRARAEGLYERSGSLVDLHNLVNILRRNDDWAAVRPLQEKLFSIERTLENAEGVVESLRRLPVPDDAGIVRFLTDNADLLARSARLSSAQAWSLFHLGRWSEADEINRALLRQRTEAADLLLDSNIAIQTGEWERFAVIIDREWPRREAHDAATLMRLASLAAESDATSDRAMRFAALAATKEPNAAQILVGALSLAFQMGRDTEADPSWMSRAVELSSDAGPIKRVDLRTMVAEIAPAHRERTQAIEQGLVRGEIPLHFVASALNVPLSNILLSMPMRNAAEPDGRRRTVIPIVSGARGAVKISAEWIIGFDITSILVLAHLDILGATIQAIHRVVLAPDTMVFLLNERRRVRFHQPSRIRKAEEIRSLIDRGRLVVAGSLVHPPQWLVAEVGRDLAELLASAKGGGGHVVHPRPIRSLRDLENERAELGEYTDLVLSVTEFVGHLHQRGKLDRASYERVRSYLAPRDAQVEGGPGLGASGIDGPIYLDDLALTYLQDAGILEEVGAAELDMQVHPSTRSDQESLIEANRHGDRLARSLDAIRQTIRDAVADGKAIFLRHRASTEAKRVDLLEEAPTLAAFLDSTGSCDGVSVDDRFVNRNALLTDRSGRTVKVVCVLDVLRLLRDQELITAAEFREKLHRLRQGCFGVMPIDSTDLEDSLRAATVDPDGRVVEGPELRAVRQTLMRVRSLDMLQQPTETAFLDRLRLNCVWTLRRLWHDESVSVEKASALAEWIWRFVAPSPLDWARTSRGRPGLRPLSEAFGVHIGLVLQVAIGLSGNRREAFRDWMERSVLPPIAIGSPELLDSCVAVLKSEIERWGNELSPSERQERRS